MLFVRCRGGISHNPAEFCSVEDMGRAIVALIGFVEAFATQASSSALSEPRPSAVSVASGN